jgi:hypothetical protein
VDFDPSNYSPLGQQRRLVIQVVDFDPSNYSPLGQRRLIIQVVDFDSSNYSPLGQQRRLIIRVVDFDPSNHFFWPAVPLYYSNDGFQSHVLFLSGLQHLYMLQGLQCHFIIRGRFHSPPSLFVQAISAIIVTNNGHQFPDFLLLGASRASASMRVEILAPQNPVPRLYLFLFTRILVAIYQFGCRMSNTKISPPLATLDGPLIESNALY